MTTSCSKFGPIGGRGTAQAVRDDGPWLSDLWRLTFRCRHVAIAAIAILSAVMPTFGDDRWYVAGPLFLLVLPYDLLLERSVLRGGRIGRLMPYTDQLAGAVFVLIEPRAWQGVLLVLVANMALIVVAFGRRVTVECALLGTAALTAAGLIAGVPDLAVGALLFLICGLGTGVIVGALSEGERAVRRDAEQFADIVERIHLALFVARLDDLEDERSLRIVSANPEAGRLTHRDPKRMIGRLVRDEFSESASSTPLLKALAGVVTRGKAVSVDSLPSDEDGTERVYSFHAFPLPDQCVGIALDDVTLKARAADALRHKALHDDLTGLPNRVLLNDRVQQALAEAQRRGSSVALLVMDLDQFKEVNDALGHHHGDRLLCELSRRMQDLLRECDTIARLGGDEFALLLTTDASQSGAIAVAEKVIALLEQPVDVDGLSLQTNGSIGIALFPEHASGAQELVQRADVAMYQAKGTSSSWAVYSAEHDRSSVRRLTLLGELRRAIQLDELVLHFQPIIDLETRRPVRVEALVRWQHPEHGLMAPGEFIELAEVSGMIGPLTRWVIERAMAALEGWRAEGHDLAVAVNLSVRNLYDANLNAWLAERLEAAGLPAGALTFEITESEVMDDPLLAMEVLGWMRRLGVSTSIDDFGTGHSSLSYLKHLPIDEIKIDRSFVAGMSTDPSDATIVRSIIDLGHNLGHTVVAEGVEEPDTLERLVEQGCDQAQGYLISRPLPASGVSRLLGRVDSWSAEVPR